MQVNPFFMASGILAATAAEHLVVLGDFIHARPGRTVALDAAFGAWRARHRELALTLVRGNHDSRAGDPAPAAATGAVGRMKAHIGPAVAPGAVDAISAAARVATAYIQLRTSQSL